MLVVLGSLLIKLNVNLYPINFLLLISTSLGKLLLTCFFLILLLLFYIAKDLKYIPAKIICRICSILFGCFLLSVIKEGCSRKWHLEEYFFCSNASFHIRYNTLLESYRNSFIHNVIFITSWYKCYLAFHKVVAFRLILLKPAQGCSFAV